MIASEILSKSIISLKTSDTGEKALTLMNFYGIRHLPVVNNVQLLGLVSEEDILSHDLGEPLGSYRLSITNPYCHVQDHIFQLIGQMAENKLTVIPVVDDNENFKGMITREDLMNFFAKSFSFTEPGSILILDINKKDYSLAEIARIVESENAAILSVFISSHEKLEKVYVTIKINSHEAERINKAFERYNYEVNAFFAKEKYEDSLDERYNSLILYLNM